MTVTLAVEFAPEAAGPALHALRQPALAVESLDLWRTDIVATVCSDGEGPVQAALAALALCPGVRVAFVGEGWASGAPEVPRACLMPPPMRHPLLVSLSGAAALGLVALGARRLASDRRARGLDAELVAGSTPLATFSGAHLEGLPEPAQRYLRHAIAPGTPLAPAVRLWMEGSMRPSPTSPRTDLTAVETLAPRRGFVWTARARMNGLPVRVRDHYASGDGGVEVVALGLVPIPLASGPDVVRSSRGRLIAEAVWCPTALVHPSVQWEAAGADLARFTLAVDGEAVAVTLHLDASGRVLEVTLDRWGDADGGPARPIPYGFRAEAEATFGGVTIPTRLVGGWFYGTDRFDPAGAARFTVHRAEFASGASA